MIISKNNIGDCYKDNLGNIYQILDWDEEFEMLPIDTIVVHVENDFHGVIFKDELFSFTPSGGTEPEAINDGTDPLRLVSKLDRDKFPEYYLWFSGLPKRLKRIIEWILKVF